MNLLISLITFNRLDYTKRTLDSLRSTLKVPHHIIVVDNNSTDGTQDWIGLQKDIDFVANEKNEYPGKACNIGWQEGLVLYPKATHLMRCDNDMEFWDGWDTQAEKYFEKIPELGQLGLDHEAIEHEQAHLRELEINGMTINFWPGVVGGPCIIRRKLYDMGLRYNELRWDDDRKSKLQEDSFLSRDVRNMGYIHGHMTDSLSRTFANESNWKDYPEYYRKTMTDRDYDDRLEKAGL